MKNILIILFTLMIATAYGQADFYNNYTKPYFIDSVKVAGYAIDDRFPEWHSGSTDAARIAAALDSNDVIVLSKVYSGVNLDLSSYSGKTLDFSRGGSLTGFTGTITGNGTKIINPGNDSIFSINATIAGTWDVPEAYADWFGVDNTGSADASVCFGLAFDITEKVIVKEGTYLVSSTINIPFLGKLIGINRDLCNIHVDSDISGITCNAQQFSIEKLRIYTAKTDYSGSLVNVNITECEDSPYNENRYPIIIRDLIIEGATTNVGTGLSVTISGTDVSDVRSYFGLIDNVHLLEWDTAIYMRGNDLNAEKTNGWRISNCVLDQYDYGLYLDEKTNGTLVTNCYFQPKAPATHSIHIESGNNRISNSFIVDYDRHTNNDTLRPAIYFGYDAGYNIISDIDLENMFDYIIDNGGEYGGDGGGNVITGQGFQTGRTSTIAQADATDFGEGIDVNSSTGVMTITNHSSVGLYLMRESTSATLFRIQNDDTAPNYSDISVNGGDLTITPAGGDINFSGRLNSLTTAEITASTTQTQGQQPLTSNVNEVSVCANDNDVVTMPTAAAGLRVTVINNGAQTLKIFPASGDDLGAGANQPVTLASGSNVSFVAFNTVTWEID